MKAKNLSFALLLLFALTELVYSKNIDINGFIQSNYSANLGVKNPDEDSYKWSEERLQLKLDTSLKPFRLFLKTDGYLDHLENKGNAEVREGYIDYTSSLWDLRIGRQVVTWGVGDLVFINDVFPKDYEAFFSGRPMEYMKKGIDGIKIGVYPGFASFEFITIPYFESNNYPDSDRFWMFDPIPNLTDREEKEPVPNFENTEIAARIYREISGFDGSLYFYKGFSRQPSMLFDNPLSPSKITLFYPELSVCGASIQGRAGDGVLSIESGYYDLLPNSQTKFLIGYQRQLWEDCTIGIQYYGEYMKDELYELITPLRITQFLKHQTLRLSFFSFWSPSDKDYMLNPEIKYNFSDNLWGATGGNIFGGKKLRTQFGQLDKNDNMYVQVRYEF